MNAIAAAFRDQKFLTLALILAVPTLGALVALSMGIDVTQASVGFGLVEIAGICLLAHVCVRRR